MRLILNQASDIKYLKEDATDGTGGKSYFIEGIFMQMNKVNRNNRVYSEDIMRREVERYLKDHVSRRRAFGELTHPNEPSINMERVSHIIEDLRIEGNDVIGRAKIIDTPYGKIVKTFMDEGVQLGVSSRGLGSVETKDGVQYVKDDFYLVTAADIVADPSAPDAFVENIMEGYEWALSGGEWIKVKNQIMEAKKVDRRELERVMTEQFSKLVRRIASV